MTNCLLLLVHELIILFTAIKSFETDEGMLRVRIFFSKDADCSSDYEICVHNFHEALASMLDILFLLRRKAKS